MVGCMTLTDGIILIVVIIIVALIVYFGFIKNRDKGQCRNCSEASGVKANRLLKDYKRRYRKDKSK
jgi:beta-lactam-binding protein with PASTA domain